MATPGWYPDPAGQPGAFRFWDGQVWGHDTTTDPAAAGGAPTQPPSRPPTQPSYQSYATHPGMPRPLPTTPAPQPQGWVPGPPPGTGHGGDARKGGGRTAGLVLLAVVVTLALGVVTFLVARPLLDDDSTDRASDTPAGASPAEAPGADPGDAPDAAPSDAQPDEAAPAPSGDPGDPFADDRTPTTRACSGGTPRQGSTRVTGGEQRGGGLTVATPRGFSDAGDLDQSAAFVFASRVSAASKVVADGWVAVQAVGALPRVNGFDSTGQAAADVLECMTLSPAFYRSFDGAEVTASEAVEVDGHPGWAIDAEIRVDDPAVDVEGDVAKVVVVDTGDLDAYGVYVSLVAIGDEALRAEQQDLAAAITVD